jgi:hypothetical protein
MTNLPRCSANFGGNRVADEHGIGEAPARFEKDGTGSRQVHRHDRIQQSARETPLHDQVPETSGGREFGINV